jgi:predicted ATPase
VGGVALRSGRHVRYARRRPGCVVDASHDLLLPDEQILFRRLAVFAAAGPPEQPESVCAGDGVDDWQVLELLAGLVDKSLVVFTEAAGSARNFAAAVQAYARDDCRPARKSRLFRIAIWPCAWASFGRSR